MQDNKQGGVNVQDLLEAGVHFGHLRSKWDPRMVEYIFMEKNGIHLIDLNKTAVKLEEAAAAMRNIARSGRKVLFVATKKQAKEIVKEAAMRVNMPFVTDRWLGGMLTNFATVRKSIKKMTNIDRMVADGTVSTMAKKERLMLSEAHKLNLTSFGIVDTNANPNDVDFAIPGNDDATKSISLITDYIVRAIEEGLAERKISKDREEKEGAVSAEAAPAATEEA